MLKASLIKLINSYQSKDSSIDYRLQELINFVNSDEIRQLLDNEDISYDDFVYFLNKSDQSDVVKKIENKYFKYSNPQCYAIFSKFKNESKRKINDENEFLSYPIELRLNIANFLNVADLQSFSKTCSALFSEMKDRDYWINKIYALNISADVIQNVISAKVIKDYRHLYFMLSFYNLILKFRSAAEIFCISGEVPAIKYAIENDSFCLNKKAALFLFAKSGSVSAIRYAIEDLKLNKNSIDKFGRNILHHVARSGNLEAIKYVMEDLKINRSSIDGMGANILHHVARSGNLEAIKYVIKSSRIDRYQRDHSERSILHYAALNGRLAVMKYIINELRVDPKRRTKHGENILHYVVTSGNLKAIKYVINDLEINPRSTDNSGSNLLHFAVLSRKLEVVKYVVEELKIDPAKANQYGGTAFMQAKEENCIEIENYLTSLQGLGNSNRSISAR